jgi:hypothetical protein
VQRTYQDLIAGSADDMLHAGISGFSSLTTAAWNPSILTVGY